MLEIVFALGCIMSGEHFVGLDGSVVGVCGMEGVFRTAGASGDGCEQGRRGANAHARCCHVVRMPCTQNGAVR